MRSKNIQNYVFLIGLIILLFNDQLLKAAFGNWWTGKLSDFAGILILPMFLKYLFPINTLKSVVITVFFFIFWKSPLSQGAIDLLNGMGGFQIGRVVDYTDFIAFLILPLSIYVLHHLDQFKIKLSRSSYHKIAAPILFCLTITAFIATSMPDEYEEVDPLSLICNCCDHKPVEAKVGSGNIFIPTMFTPNGDGINDFFQISADSNILKIDSFSVYNLNHYYPIFEQKNIVDIIPSNGFNGMEEDTILATQYHYYIAVTSVDGEQKIFLGTVCSLPCTQQLPIPIPERLDSCAFSTQYGADNRYDANMDSEEHLDCFQ